VLGVFGLVWFLTLGGYVINIGIAELF